MPEPTPVSVKPVSRYVQDFFIYEVDFLALAGLSTANGNIAIQADSDFKLLKMCYFADIAAAIQTEDTRVIPLCTCTITDQGSGRQLMSAFTPVPSIFGVGEIPFIMPIPRIFTARSIIAVAVTNLTAATTYNLRLSFIGAKLFKMQ
jgi:hypothetical protein